MFTQLRGYAINSINTKVPDASRVMGVKSEIVEELHKPIRKNFKRRRVILKGLNDLYQADLVEMIPYAKVNKGFRYILVAINAFSKFVWAVPIKRKTGIEVTKAMQKILSEELRKIYKRTWGRNSITKSLRL